MFATNTTINLFPQPNQDDGALNLTQAKRIFAPAPISGIYRRFDPTLITLKGKSISEEIDRVSAEHIADLKQVAENYLEKSEEKEKVQVIVDALVKKGKIKLRLS